MPNSVRCLVVLMALGVCCPEPAICALKSTTVPRFDAAVKKAIGYLVALPQIQEREEALVAYALSKAGMDLTDTHVAKGLAAAKERAASSHYQGYDHIYLAGVDAMLLADTDSEGYFNELQNIANYVQSVQRRDGSWSDTATEPGDVSMTQYGVLALWAAQRAGCKVSPQSLDGASSWLMAKGNGDGGWGYRPGTNRGPGAGGSTHNMTLAAAGSIAVGRTLLHGRKGKPRTDEPKPTAKFGVLEKEESEEDRNARLGVVFPGYSPQNAAGSMDDRITRGLGWVQARFQPVSQQDHKIYFYYTLERAAALADLPDGWYTTYGDGLLTLQNDDGKFNSHAAVGSTIATSFAILYYMRSTKQILDKQFGKGLLKGNRGLDTLFGDKKEKKELGPLDELLGAMEKADLSQLDDVSTEDIVEKVTFSSRDELVGQVDLLKKLLQSPDAANRQVAYWALGRTGDFGLVPLMLKGLRDPSVDCNVEALNSLRYIARKPNGFGLSLQPLKGAETADEARKVEVANQWRTKAYKTWGDWYRKVRPFDEGGGLDELELISQGR